MDQIVYQHQDSAAGKWAAMPVYLQMGNIGSEISRALKWKQKGKEARANAAAERALELFDLSLACNKSPKLKEICRAREEFCDYFYGENYYQTDPVALQGYYDQFALLRLSQPAED